MRSILLLLALLPLSHAVRTAAQKRYDATGLKHLHIPKTAGGTIETLIGRENNPDKRLTRGKRIHYRPFVDDAAHAWPRGYAARTTCPYWHVPPRFRRAGAGAPDRTWCVVRDPVDRVLSVFKEQHPKSLNDSRAAVAWIRSFLPVEGMPFPVGRACHLVPQTVYVFGGDGERTCGIVLRLERIGEDVDALMRASGLEWRWATDFDIAAQRRTHHAPSNLTAAALPAAARDLVLAAYRDDACRLGYAPRGLDCSGAATIRFGVG